MTKKTIKEELIESITNDIINGVYSSDHVFTEKALIEKYCVSKSPVRDALIELCNSEVLKSIPRYGYVIIPISEKKIRDIAELRLIIEPTAFKSNCEKYYDDILSFIKKHNQKDTERKLNGKMPMSEEWKSNIGFHIGLLSFSENQYICEIIEKSLDIIYRSYIQLYEKQLLTYKKTPTSLVGGPHHERIQCLLENGDIDGAVNALREDIMDMGPKRLGK